MYKSVPYIDIHTHDLSDYDGVVAVYNRLVNESQTPPESLFSAGLHPWYADQLSQNELASILDSLASQPNFVAFGETGLDKKCQVPMRIQMEIFEFHLKKAVEYNKPVILHCIGAWEDLLKISANYPVIKILHGYNGSPELTRQLLRLGFRFSIGKLLLNKSLKINNSIQLIPLTSIFCETDSSEITIQDIYHEVCLALHINEAEFKVMQLDNFSRLFNKLELL